MDEVTRLALAARDGDRDALADFIGATQAEVWRFVAHQVGETDADDVTQDVYVRAWRSLPTFRQEASARTWLLAIARRAGVDALRRRGRHQRLAERLGRAPAPTAAPDPTSTHAITALVDTLDTERREAFVLTQLLGCSYDETAEICGVPVGTIRSRVARARCRSRRGAPRRRGGMMRLARVGLALLLGIGTVVVAADPAGAHGVAGIQPSNFATEVRTIVPAERGLTVEAVDLGNKLQLDNRTGRDVTVLGYDNEPYLRVGPAGVFQNDRSPAVYLNRTRTGNVTVPRSADPSAPPQWRKIGDGTTVRWHDHRAHWLAATNPPEVQSNPGARHLVQRWTVTLVRDGTRIAVHGDVVWIPGPSPWGFVAVAVALAAGLVALGVTRFDRTVVAVALAAMLVGETADVLGSWEGTTVSGVTKLAASAYALGGMAVGVLALVWVLRRGVRAAAPLLLLTGLFLALAGGLADVTVLYRSQLPTTLPDTWARLEVATVIGLGVGVAIIGALRLRATPHRVRRATPTSPAVPVTAR